jgi:hypothetical protein
LLKTRLELLGEFGVLVGRTVRKGARERALALDATISASNHKLRGPDRDSQESSCAKLINSLYHSAATLSVATRWRSAMADPIGRVIFGGTRLNPTKFRLIAQ